MVRLAVVPRALGAKLYLHEPLQQPAAAAEVGRSPERRKTQMAVVRPEQPGDVAAIHAVHAASFATDVEARLVSLLRAAGHLLVSLVAETDRAIVGHGAFRPASAATRL